MALASYCENVNSGSLSERGPGALAAWVSSFAPSTAVFHRSGSDYGAKCDFRMTERECRHAPQSSQVHTSVSRRAALHGIAAYSGLLLFSPLAPVLAFDDQMENCVSDSLGLSIDYPVGWYRSERGGKLVLLNLKQVIAATLSKKPVRLSPKPDPYGAAYEMVRDRIEKEGAMIVIKEAAFEPDNTLLFRFEATTEMPDGDSVVRFGLSRCLPSKDGESAIACIITMPKQSWDELRPLADRMMSSLKLV